MSERSAVQNPMLKYAAEIGWETIPASDALQMRRGDTGLYFADVLESQMMRLNWGILDETRCKEIVRRLNLLNPTLEGNQRALSWLRGEQSIFVPKEKRERNVTLIDYEAPNNNLFHVTDEWWQRGAVHRNRADVVFLINGIPVAVVETKSAGKADGLAAGVEQIRRYHEETPEMFTIAQLFGVTQLLEFFYGVTWNVSRKNLFNWKSSVAPLIKEVGGLQHKDSSDLATGEPANYEAKVKTFFDRTRFLGTLRESIIFQSRDDALTKVVLRQHQTRAVEKVIKRVYDPHRRRGLIWHTQGSGKTLTMITIASRLLRGGETEKPTVLMIVDRNELESQLFRNIAGYGISTPKVAASKQDLQAILASDYRGLIVSMIHKFDDIPANINTRESVTVLVDEAHRTTGGDLGNYLMAALPNATYIGFTGTPIDNLAQGKGTFKVFGVDDEPRGYLDKYAIAESIKDGTTVPLNYALAPSELRVDRETLEREFLNLADAEGVSDLEELNAILDRAVRLKEMMKAPDRIDNVAVSAAKHFQENVEPMGFKAFLVAVDREACALYKTVLDKHLPPEYSEAVYSDDTKDSALMKAYHRSHEEEKEIRKKFADKTAHPKILIVTQKLLTGYDAPILYCIYLDKPMRDHVLLQAIARVNRPYEDDDGLVKPYGFVLDYVGIFEDLEKALAFDSDEVESVIENLDVLKGAFAERIRDGAQAYLPFARGWDDKAKERAIERFRDKDAREAFFKFFRDTQNFYNIISPDSYLRPFMDDYQALASLYSLIRNAYADRIYVDKELTAKTRELLQQHTDSDRFEMPGAIQELNADTLKRAQESQVSDSVKVLNLRKLLQKKVIDESRSKPFLISIGERAEAITEAYENRQLTTQQVLLEFGELAERYQRASSERVQMDLDENAYAVYTILKTVTEKITPNQARDLNRAFDQFPDYQWDERQRSKLRSMFYAALRPIVGTENLIDATNQLLKLERV